MSRNGGLEAFLDMGEAERGASMGEGWWLGVEHSTWELFLGQTYGSVQLMAGRDGRNSTCLELGKGWEKALDSVDIYIKATRYSLKRFLEGREQHSRQLEQHSHTIRKQRVNQGRASFQIQLKEGESVWWLPLWHPTVHGTCPGVILSMSEGVAVWVM